MKKRVRSMGQRLPVLKSFSVLAPGLFLENGKGYNCRMRTRTAEPRLNCRHDMFRTLVERTRSGGEIVHQALLCSDIAGVVF